MRPPAGRPATPRTSPRLRYRLQYVTCRQRHCRVCEGQRLAHGPYWFVVGGGALGARRYAGRDRPAGVTAAAEATQRRRAEAERDRKERARQARAEARSRRAADVAGLPVDRSAPLAALRHLGLGPESTADQVKRAYRQQALACHPDRPGGSHQAMQALNEVLGQALQGLAED
jgi:hypothetical protein